MAQSPDKIGSRFGKFKVLCHLKSGGMGAVYRAQDRDTGREVALKILSAESAANPKRLERFRREAQHGALLHHENIVGLYEFGEVDGTYFLTMEYVEGVDLDEYVRQQGVLSAEEARLILLQLAKALDHAHRVNVVHRDIKPSNILLAQQHGRVVVKLADLGLARGGVDEESRVTADGTTVGTVDYMAPEQARDSGQADIRSDIYSLGCTLYHMLAGQPPFAEGSLIERVVKHAKAEPTDLRQRNPEVPEDLWAICRRMLAKKPTQRYQTPGELLADLHAATVPTAPRRVAKKAAAAKGAEPGQIAAGQFEHGTQAIATGNFDYGLMLLLNCCQREPGNLAYRQGLRQAQLARAVAGLGAWRSLPFRLYFLARFKLAQYREEPLQVLRFGEELLTCNPDDLDTQLVMAEAAREISAADVAVWMLEHAQERDPDSLPVKRALASAYEQQGETRRAITLWEVVAKHDPDDREARNKVRDLLASETTRTVYHDRNGRPRHASTGSKSMIT